MDAVCANASEKNIKPPSGKLSTAAAQAKPLGAPRASTAYRQALGIAIGRCARFLPEMDEIAQHLRRIADALERLSPPPPDLAPLDHGSAFVWRPGAGGLIAATSRAPGLDLILEVDRQKAALLANTEGFAQNRPANNALLWGARGTGKSALVKAVHRHVVGAGANLKLIEVPRATLAGLPGLITALAESRHHAIVFLDDLSFEADDPALKALKPALDGGLSARAENLIVYATSNRRQLVARGEGEAADTPFARDRMDETLSLSDRFGLWLGFHPLDEAGYLRIAQAYAARMRPSPPEELVHARARAFAMLRGARTGRTAYQFALDLAADLGAELGE